MVTLQTLRAPLFVPATRPERFGKAAASGACAVILDLEDAVGLDDKDTARANLSSDFTHRPVIVRMNAPGTRWHAEDLTATAALPLAAVMVPKAEDPATLAAIARTTGHKVVALIESARGVACARAIAAAEGVERLAFGSIDFCADLGCDHDRKTLMAARFELVMASRLAEIAPPIDGVTVDLSDPAITEDDSRHARSLGMTGKLCIHPRQVAAVRAGFAPSDAERDWARRILSSGDGAVAVDGAMVDAPVRIRARAILAAR